MTVNKERVRLLVDALRSGEFQQGKVALRSHDRKYHCCLGVATEVALRNGVVVEDKNQGFPWSQTNQIMCAEVYDWYGFPTGNPELKGDMGWIDHPIERNATIWNDDLDASLETIGDYFERTFLGPDEASAA